MNALKITARQLITQTPMPKVEALQAKLEETTNHLQEAKKVIPLMSEVLQKMVRNDLPTLEDFLKTMQEAIHDSAILKYIDVEYLKEPLKSSREEHFQKTFIKILINSM